MVSSHHGRVPVIITGVFYTMIQLIGYGLEDSGFEFQEGHRIFLSSKICRTFVGHTRLLFSECLASFKVQGKERSRHEIAHSVPRKRISGSLLPFFVYVLLA